DAHRHIVDRCCHAFEKALVNFPQLLQHSFAPNRFAAERIDVNLIIGREIPHVFKFVFIKRVIKRLHRLTRLRFLICRPTAADAQR
ncbi:MAG: hypothetical protein ABJB34_10690, partial [Acidobacteriota bacterium]